MSSDKPEITAEAFEKLAEAAGLTLDPAEKERMREGYLGLQTLLARLPEDPAMADEPALVFQEPSSRVVR